ncbi:hypothetical protein [Kitasatospora sp. NPDC057223]|uniref:hypothetical protein n=1 Tax=Kitasatospora sp. NPDC057223 TaxID=3346055 RepID=UPI00363C57A9
MVSIPLAAGDLRWAFPELADEGAVRAALLEADEQFRAVTALLRGPTGRPDGGFCFDQVDGIVSAGVTAFAEAADATVIAWLGFPRRCGWDLRWGPPWQVSAEIEVPCDRGDDCAGHLVADLTDSYLTPLAAARGLVTATGWLLGQIADGDRESWRPEPCD